MLEPGDVVDGKYRIVRKIAQGGMGVVYECRNMRIDRAVAIKVMHASIANDEELVKRFRREALASARVQSSYVASVFDLGDLPCGDQFMVMELLEGETLSSRIKREGPLSPAATVELALQVLEGLGKIHDAGIIHRDLTCANVFLVPSGEGDVAKILDLGVCKFVASGDEELTRAGGAVSRTREKPAGEFKTEIGRLMGTVAYMAPEYLEHGSATLDTRADLYSVGVILFRCLSGVVPCKGTTPPDVLSELRSGKARVIEELVPDLDAKLAAIVERSMEWDPAARFQTAAEFRLALGEWTETSARVTDLLSDFLEVPRSSRQPPAGSVRPSGQLRLSVPTPRPATASAAPKSEARRRKRAPSERPTARPPEADPRVEPTTDAPPPLSQDIIAYREPRLASGPLPRLEPELFGYVEELPILDGGDAAAESSEAPKARTMSATREKTTPGDAVRTRRASERPKKRKS